MTNAIVRGSLSQVAKRDNKSIAEAFMDVDAIILVDVSGSMSMSDGTGKTRLERAKKELIRLQNEMSGKLAIVAFSDTVTFIPNGILPDEQSTTNLTSALRYAHSSDAIPDFGFIVISDGSPDNPSSALDMGRKFQNKIDTVYIGNENGSGKKFLQRLSEISGGQSMTKSAGQISNAVVALLGE